MNPSSLFARDHPTACMQAPLQALDARRALRAVVEHDRIPGQGKVFAQALELALRMEHQFLEPDFDIASHEVRGTATGFHILSPHFAEHAQVLAGSKPGLAPGEHRVARIPDQMNEVRLRQERCDLRHQEHVARRFLAVARLALALRIHGIEAAQPGGDGKRVDRLEPAPQQILVESEIRPVGNRDTVCGDRFEEALPDGFVRALQHRDRADERGLRRNRDLRVAIEHHRQERGPRSWAADDDRQRASARPLLRGVGRSARVCACAAR